MYNNILKCVIFVHFLENCMNKVVMKWLIKKVNTVKIGNEEMYIMCTVPSSSVVRFKT